jgi:hypothetical protein
LGASQISSKSSQLLDEVLQFVEGSEGLSSTVNADGKVEITQSVDGKSFNFRFETLEEVLPRTDADGKNFIQINFESGIKVLFTDTLVGFKPRETMGLDMAKIPRVVTTPDLLSVFEAIEESLSSDGTPDTEVEILKKVFQAILAGGESAGFDLSVERRWLARLMPLKFRASA